MIKTGQDNFINSCNVIIYGDKSPTFSSEKLTKAILRLPSHLRNKFYKFTKDSNLMDGSINLLVGMVRRSNKSRLSLHKLTNRTNINFLKASQEVPDSSVLESKKDS